MLPVIDRFRADHELFRGNDVVSYAGTDGVTRKPVRITRYMASPGSSTQILKQVRSVRSRFTTHIHAVHHEPKRRIFSVVEPAPCCTAQLLIDLLYANPSDRVVLHEELIWEIAAASITALGHLADQGLTHMGISPGAIHLTEMGPRLACPRLSRTLLPEDVQNMDIQTLQFTAPEVIAGRGYIPQSDLWSLGATLYACCTGKPPAILQTIRSQEALETAYFDVSYDVASHASSELASLIISLLAPLAESDQNSVSYASTPEYRQLLSVSPLTPASRINTLLHFQTSEWRRCLEAHMGCASTTPINLAITCALQN